MTYEKWKAYYDLAGKHPVAADLEHNVLFALGDWIDDHNVLTTRLEAAEATCQSLRDQSSRWEAQALEAGVRIAELEARVRELRVALESMVYQFGYDDGKGNFWCGGLSALEEAFETLGWGVKHPIPKGMLCDEPDCKQRATCGTPTPSGYRSVCGEHYRAALAEAPKAGEEKPCR
jgi:hypothetical protein